MGCIYTKDVLMMDVVPICAHSDAMIGGGNTLNLCLCVLVFESIRRKGIGCLHMLMAHGVGAQFEALV